MNKNRFRNPYFWLGLVGVIGSASGIDINTITNWNVLLNSIMEIFRNPCTLVSVIMAVVGVFVNPVTKGFKDIEE